MTKLHLTLVLAVEAVVIGLLWFLMSGSLALLFVPILPLTLVVALLLHYLMRNPGYRARRLSPEAIVAYQTRESETETPEELSHRIVERADEIHRTLLESPSEVHVEMCALGYRACANDMITLTHLTNEALPNASLLKRIRLRRSRKKAIDALSEARKALPPGALRTAPQERQ